MATRRPAATVDAGDLRQRILDTSRALLAEQGVAGLSLREVARRAGVTHQAPYHHFANRESILAELVVQGFDELASRLARANRLAPAETAHAVMVASGMAYVSFALDQPGVFRVMFRTDLCDLSQFGAAADAAARAYDELLQMVQLTLGDAQQQEYAAINWAQVHGLAMLLLDGPIGQDVGQHKARLAMARGMLQIFCRQMLASTHESPST